MLGEPACFYKTECNHVNEDENAWKLQNIQSSHPSPTLPPSSCYINSTVCFMNIIKQTNSHYCRIYRVIIVFNFFLQINSEENC